MDIEYLKQAKKAKKMKLQEISDLSGIPKRTVDGIFSGKTANPRTDTLQAIERALGLTHEAQVEETLTLQEKELLSAFRALNDTMRAYALQIVKGAVSAQETTTKNKNIGDIHNEQQTS